MTAANNKTHTVKGKEKKKIVYGVIAAICQLFMVQPSH